MRRVVAADAVTLQLQRLDAGARAVRLRTVGSVAGGRATEERRTEGSWEAVPGPEEIVEGTKRGLLCGVVG
jgi:hypothetical protein